jgi:hypothetical protein
MLIKVVGLFGIDPYLDPIIIGIDIAILEAISFIKLDFPGFLIMDL